MLDSPSHGSLTWHSYLKSRTNPPSNFNTALFLNFFPFFCPYSSPSYPPPPLCPFLSTLTFSLQFSLSKKVSAMKGGKSSTRGGNADSKLSVKKNAGKKGKDPNKPKRPPSAFFVFMEDFRKQYKEKHPNNKSVAAVGKAGGEKWKSLSDAEKAPFIEKAEKRKKEYEKNMQAYNKKQSEGAGDDDSDKSKSEVNDEDGSGEDEEDDDDE